MKEQVEKGRALGTPLRGFFVGAALTIAGSSALAAFSDDPAVWIAPIGVGVRFWNGVVALLFGALLVHALRPLPRWPRRVTGLGLALLAVGGLRDARAYFELLSVGTIDTRRALPASLAVLALLLWGGALLLRAGPKRTGWWDRLALTVAIPGGGLVALLVLLMTFAATDYRRPADCAVVLGAGVYPDGTPSLTLNDRVGEGIRLYHEGLVPRLLMTGGVDPGHGLSEPQVMRRLGIEAGVPESAIWLDEEGVNTRASARNCAARLEREGLESALLVSHGYHLLRAKAAFRREGLRTFTVPATETRRLAREPYFVVRECAAWVWYALPWS